MPTVGDEKLQSSGAGLSGSPPPHRDRYPAEPGWYACSEFGDTCRHDVSTAWKAVAGICFSWSTWS